jgi:hypothetical protein
MLVKKKKKNPDSNIAIYKNIYKLNANTHTCVKYELWVYLLSVSTQNDSTLKCSQILKKKKKNRVAENKGISIRVGKKKPSMP